MRRPLLVTALLAGFLFAGCTGSIRWLGVQLFYDAATADGGRELRDVAYVEGSQLPQQRLDLLLPRAGGFPIVVFVHGGGWTGGDKGLVVAGADVYRNVGRFLASQGIGAAIVNYRLQPAVTWREQVRDVAAALAWVRGHAAEHGGDPSALFVAGHSAGAQLVAYVALATWPLGEVGLSTDLVCGVVAASGAGYDLEDRRTYELGAEPAAYEEVFRAGDPGDAWLHEASAARFVSARAPRFLVMVGAVETPPLRHQAALLDQKLRDAGAASRLLEARRQTHEKMVLALSRGDTEPGKALVDFVRDSPCGRRGARAPAPGR